MKFSHLADIHIGAYNDPKLSKIILENFSKAVSISIEEKVDFMIIAGDLFHTALPGIDNLKETVIILKKLKEKNIPVYVVAGSHDYSSSGKTMIDILDHAGLLHNLLKAEQDENGKLKLKFTENKKTGAKLTGILGKKKMLDRNYYENLDRPSLENEKGFKIFVFHTSLDELKPKDYAEMESIPLSLLPKGFDYYAGGHVHIVEEQFLAGYGKIVYPGPIFPINFLELEELKHGSFVIYDDGKIKRVALDTVSCVALDMDCTNMSPEQIKQEIFRKMPPKLDNKIVALRLYGNIDSKITDIDFNQINEEARKRNAFYLMRNTSKLQSKQFREVKTHTTTQEEAEDLLIREFSSNFQFKAGNRKIDEDFLKELLQVMTMQKASTQKEHEKEIIEKARKLFDL